MIDIEQCLDEVAAALDRLDPPPVFVGGAVIGLFLDDFGRSQMRPTVDVDCIVPEVLTTASWWRLEQELRGRGWSPDPLGPICRYTSPNGTWVDLMPERPNVLGFAGRWYPRAVQSASARLLTSGRTILVPTSALMFACKLEAFGDRGVGDPYTSKDLEDIAALLDGCRELVDVVQDAVHEVRADISFRLQTITNDRHLHEALLAHLPRAGDRSSQEARVMSTLQDLTTPQ